jgi:(E)-4-hydroxy-3-methylbut-2-enyl-diphosphate synthase
MTTDHTAQDARAVAVMGCVVNGPGEAREADLGVASGNGNGNGNGRGRGRGRGQIFVKGKVIKTVPEHQIVEALIEEAMRIAEEAGETEQAGSPTVTVS